MKNWLGYLLCVCILTGLPSFAVVGKGKRPDDVIKSMNQRLIHRLKGVEKLKPAEKVALFRSAVKEVFMPNIAADEMIKSVVGVKHWQTLSVKEQAELVAAFETMVIRSYSGVVSDMSYVGHQIKIRRYSIRPGSQYMLLRTVLIMPNHEQYNINYSFIKRNMRWFVIDFTINGISFTDNYRAQFRPVLDKGGAHLLLEKLKKRNKAS